MPRKAPAPFPSEKMNVQPTVIASPPLQFVTAKPEVVTCDCGSGLKVDADAKCQDCRVLPWTPEELLKVKHLGPGLIGKAMHDAAQALAAETDNGRFGPALLGIIPDSYKDQRTLSPKDAA